MSRPLRVLIVEDETVVAMMVEDMISDLGHVPIGPAVDLESGLTLAVSEALDAAVLDVNLNGKKSYPIADILIGRGVPVIFATGYGPSGVEDRHRVFSVLRKPFAMTDLAKALISLQAR